MSDAETRQPPRSLEEAIGRVLPLITDADMQGIYGCSEVLLIGRLHLELSNTVPEALSI